MYRSDRLVISRPMFAINLATVRVKQEVYPHGIFLSGECEAAWFRRKNRVTRACVGRLHLWGHHLKEEIDVTAPAEQLLAAPFDGRYGGDTEARWDGETLWAPGANLEGVESYLHVLRPLLDAYPAVPEGFDGWWAF